MIDPFESKRDRMVVEQLEARGIKTAAVLAAFRQAQQLLNELGCSNVHYLVADGLAGWPVGRGKRQKLVKIHRRASGFEQKELLPASFVPCHRA